MKHSERGRASLSLFLRQRSSLRDMIRYCQVLPHMSSRFGRSLYERKSRHSRKERAAPRWREPRFSRDESEDSIFEVEQALLVARFTEGLRLLDRAPHHL